MTELPNIARLFLALFLVSLWLAHRANRAPLYWALAYLSLAAGSFCYVQGMRMQQPLLLQLAAVFPGIYVGFFWAGLDCFREHPPRWRVILAVAAGCALAVSLSLNLPGDLSGYVVALEVAVVTTLAARVIWDRNRKYRLVAVIVFAQGLLLALVYSEAWMSLASEFTLAAGYSLLAIGLTYVISREVSETISRHATLDELTGLANRRLCLDLLDSAVRSSTGAGLTAALIFVHLDNLRRLYDTAGEGVGDAVVRQFADRMRGATPRDHTIARVGSDEFVVLLPILAEGDFVGLLEDAATRALACVSEPFAVGGQTLTVVVNIGIASAGAGEVRSAAELLHQAKVAASEARREGGNATRFFNKEMDARAQRAVSIERGIWRGLQTGAFAIAYQPIVHADTHRLAKVEALLRWTDAELGVVHPDEFIPHAEQTGAIVELGAWVIDEACRQAMAWNAGQARPIVMCVNVSALQLHRAGFAAGVALALQRHRLAPQLLELELTENVLIGDDENVHHTIHELHEMGVSLSLDDFGTGFSSLSYLNRFAFDTIKIDKTFVQNIESNERNQRLTESICAIAKSLGLRVVAEGVASLCAAELLATYGVDHLQGYLFAPPLRAAEFAALVTVQPLPPGTAPA